MIGFFEPKAFILEGRAETKALGSLAAQSAEASRILVIEGPSDLPGRPYEEMLARSSPEHLDVQVRGTDPFLLMITSGTTGFPKACSIDHETYSLRCLNYGLTKGMNKDERALMTLPVHFNAGRGSVMSILYLGGTIYIEEKFDETSFLETIEGERITYTMLVPVLCERLLRSPALDRYRTSSLRYLGITGGHLSQGLARDIRARLCPDLYEAYASTDCGQITSIGPEDWDAHSDTVGKPIWCVLLRIESDGGSDAAPAMEGEICVRTPLAIQGYYRNSAATDEFRAGGWCHTGDIGFVDERGYLHVSGRKKNMVKSGGISIFPEEIEEVLGRHPAVSEAAVIGVRDERWGEAVKAFVVLKPDTRVEPDALMQFCKQSLASYKAPKQIDFLPILPRTGLGKIDRAKLQTMTGSKSGESDRPGLAS
jgi:acyl-CoA synthetase (AMP-forming)/AMP-acid ligase II